jgi:hypothetical protein
MIVIIEIHVVHAPVALHGRPDNGRAGSAVVDIQEAQEPRINIRLDVKRAAVLTGFAVSHVHGEEFNRNIAPDTEHPFAMDVRSSAYEDARARQQSVRTWKILELATPDHKYEHPISPRPAAVAAAWRHLNDGATDINPVPKTLFTVVQPCEQLMYVTSPMLTTFCLLG